MKIVNGRGESHFALSRIATGDTLRFKSCLAHKHEPDDIFMVVGICSSYRPFIMHEGKMPVVNLRSGELAYVDKNRPCYPVDAEVCVS